MIIKQSDSFTRNIFLFDLILNWTLGLVLVFIPEIINKLIFKSPVFGSFVYTVLGVLFLLFALWQTIIHGKKSVLRPFNLAFAALLAVIPVVLLTQALLSFGSLLRSLALMLLWLGNIYMVFLTAWYLFAIFIFSHQKRRQPTKNN